MSWDQPTACKLTDPKVVANNSPSTVTLNYLKPIIDWIDTQPSKFNGKNYMEGFSQNAATTAYLSLCLHDKITGYWTGGLPKVYEKEERWNGTAWPCFSKNGPIIACGGIYSNDRYLKGSGGIEGRNESYDMMLKEGHDPRVFIFKGPSTDKTIGGSHNSGGASSGGTNTPASAPSSIIQPASAGNNGGSTTPQPQPQFVPMTLQYVSTQSTI